MLKDNIQSVLFSEEFHRPLTVTVDQPDSSSDGSAVLLKAVDSEVSLNERLEACMCDSQDSAKAFRSDMKHIRQAVYGIAFGYIDCNDADVLADDPMQKLLLDPDPI